MSPLPFRKYFRHTSLNYPQAVFRCSCGKFRFLSHLVEDDVVCIAGILEAHVGANVVPTSPGRGEHSAPESGTKEAFLVNTHNKILEYVNCSFTLTYSVSPLEAQMVRSFAILA
jgi:hypothetical protein